MVCPSCGAGVAQSTMPAGFPNRSAEVAFATNPYSPALANTTGVAATQGRNTGKLIFYGTLWSVAFYMLGSVLFMVIFALSGGKSADATPLAIKVVFVAALILTLLSPLLVIWLTIRGKLPGTRKG